MNKYLIEDTAQYFPAEGIQDNLLTTIDTTIYPINNTLRARADAFIMNYVDDNLEPGEEIVVELAYNGREFLNKKHGKQPGSSYFLEKENFTDWYKKNKNEEFNKNLMTNSISNLMVAAQFGAEFPNITKIYSLYALPHYFYEKKKHLKEAQFIESHFINVISVMNPSTINNQNLKDFLDIASAQSNREELFEALIKRCTYFKKHSNQQRTYNEAVPIFGREVVDQVFAKQNIVLEQKDLFTPSTARLALLDYNIDSLIASKPINSLMNNQVSSNTEYVKILQYVVMSINQHKQVKNLGIEKVVHLDKGFLLYTLDNYSESLVKNCLTSLYHRAADVHNEELKKSNGRPKANILAALSQSMDIIMEKALISQISASSPKARSTLKI